MEAPAQVDKRALRSIPRADDHFAVEPGQGNGLIEGFRHPGELVDKIGAERLQQPLRLVEAGLITRIKDDMGGERGKS